MDEDKQGCTMRELHDALIRALRETSGALDYGRLAEMSDVGEAFMAMQECLNTLVIVDRPRYLVDRSR